MRYPSCADLPRSLARALVILSSLSCKSFRTARNCCILHSFVLVIPLLIVWLSSSTICGTRKTVSSSCWVAIPLAPQLETPKSAQIQATKSPSFGSGKLPQILNQYHKCSRPTNQIRNYIQILLKLFSNSSTQTLFKFYSDFTQFLLKLFSNSSTRNLFKFYSDFIQILLKFFHSNSFQILFRFHSISTQIIFKFFYSKSFQILLRFHSNSTQILLLKLFSNSIQISLNFYSNYFQILLLEIFSNSTQISFKFFYSNYFQNLLLKLFSNSIQISFKFYSKIRKLCHQELYLTSDIKFRLNFAPALTH